LFDDLCSAEVCTLSLHDALPILMPVEDVFSITGRGTVATGRVERGVIKVGDPVEIVGMQEEKLTSTVTGVEMFRKLLEQAEAGRSEEHTSELQSRENLVCRLLLE